MRLHRIILVLAAVLVAVLSFAGCVTITGEKPTTETPSIVGPAPTTPSPDSTKPETSAPRVGRMAPGFDLDNLGGQSVSLASLRGQYVMLNFWATWCGPCRFEMPFMQEIYENPEWSARDVVIVAVNIEESAAQVEEFLAEFGLDFMVLLDSNARAARAYNISGIPTTFFIDRDGIIRDIRIGTFRSRAEIEGKLQNLIDG